MGPMPPRKRLPAPAHQPAPGTTTPGGPTVTDTQANPAGPPEGTEDSHVGVGPEVPENAVTHQAPGAQGAPEVQHHPRTTGSPSGRLVAYLLTHHPADYPHVTPEGPEHPADTAVRLLQRLGARGTAQARCQEAYCNAPQGHTGPHGWVNVQ